MRTHNQLLLFPLASVLVGLPGSGTVVVGIACGFSLSSRLTFHVWLLSILVHAFRVLVGVVLDNGLPVFYSVLVSMSQPGLSQRIPVCPFLHGFLLIGPLLRHHAPAHLVKYNVAPYHIC